MEHGALAQPLHRRWCRIDRSGILAAYGRPPNSCARSDAVVSPADADDPGLASSSLSEPPGAACRRPAGNDSTHLSARTGTSPRFPTETRELLRFMRPCREAVTPNAPSSLDYYRAFPPSAHRSQPHPASDLAHLVDSPLRLPPPRLDRRRAPLPHA